MQVYHGSNHRFSKIRISPSLSNSQASSLNEGAGIYFSTDRGVAESYGKYLYTLDINKSALIDFRTSKTCASYMSNLNTFVQRESGIRLSDYLQLRGVAEYVYFGNIAVAGIGRELGLLLDSDERYSLQVPQYRKDKVGVAIRKFLKQTLRVYMFNYNIKNIGVIKKADDDTVRIISIDKVH